MPPAMMFDLRDLPWPFHVLAWAIVVTPFVAILFLALLFWRLHRRSKRRPPAP